MKDYRNIESNRAPRDLESWRHGPWRGWINRRFAKRLFSMLVVVCLLSNTLGLVVDDINAAQTRLASAEILEINPEPFAFAEDLETDTSLADAYDDALDQLGDLSLSNNLASNAAGDGKTYAYRLEDETRLLLSDLIVKLELPVRQLKDIQSVSLQNNGANTGIDMSLFVAIAEVEDDYLIVLKPLFAEARLTVYTVDGMFNLRLVNDPTLTAEEVAKAAMALSEDPEGFGPLFSCDLRDASSKIRLSALLKRAGLPIKVSDVVDLGVIEHNGKEGQCLTIEKGKKDYRLTVIRSFNEIELAVFTGSKSYTIVLQNGRASDSEQTETDVFDSSLEIPEIDDIGLEDASSGDLIEVSGQNDELGIDIGVDLDVEQVETPVSEAEPEVEQIQEPEAEAEVEPAQEQEAEPEIEQIQEPETEREQEPEVEPEVEQIEEPEDVPEVEQIEEPEAATEQEPEIEQIEEPEAATEQEPEVEQIEEPEQEPEAEPEVEQIEEPEAAPEQEPEAEPEIEQIEEPETAPDQEPEAEPEVEQIEEPEAAPEQEPEVEPEVEQIEEPEQEPEAEPEVEQIEEPEQEPEAEPEVEQIEEPEQEPEAEPEVEQIEEPEQDPEVEPEVEQIEEPEQEPEAEPEVEQIEEPEAEPEHEPEAEPEIEQIEEPEAAPEQESEVEPESEPVVEPEQEPEAETEAEPTQESGGSDDAESGIRQEAVSSPEATQDGALEIVPEDGAQEEIVSEETPKQESEDEVDDVSAVEPEALPEVEPGTEAQTDEPSPEPETAVGWPAASFAARASGVNVTVTADEGAFPEGTTMSVRRVWDADALSEIRESVADDFVKVRRVQLVDIAFYDAEGNEIEPRIPVSVVISVSEINDDQSAVVVHMDDEGQTQIVADTDVESASGRTNLNVELPAGDTEPGEVEIEQTEVGVGDVETEISFDADGFSLYAVVVTETISTHYIDASGNTYSVEVSYGPEAGIPSGAKLAVSELEGDEAEAYIGAALEAVENDGNNDANSKKTTLKYAKALDISILMDGVEVRPVAPISVSIKLLDAPNSDEFDEANVVHFGDEAEVVESNIQREAVRFETDGFSVYVVTYTLSTFYMDAAGNTFNIEVEYDREAGIPEGAQLRVSELEGDVADTYAAQAAEALNVASSQLAYAKALDISILADGQPVQPQAPVSVSIRLLDAPEATENTNIDVIHFGDQPEPISCALEGDAVTFETDGFSVYVVLCTTLRKTLTAGDGNEYSVTVTYDSASGIPSDAELYVSEIKEDDAGYDEYVARSAAALGEKPENLAFARAFDITLKNPRTGEEYQPNKNVAVTIELLKDDLNSYASVDVVHIHDEAGREAEVMDSTVYGESVEFETSGFSVYVLIGSGGETVTPQCTYTFYVPDPDRPGEYKEYAFKDSQGQTIYKQTITSGEELVVPQLTSTDTEVFAGWYENVTDGAGGFKLAESPYDFDNITVTENSAVDLYAVYTNYAMVIFHDQYDSSSETFPVAYTRRAELVTTGEGESATSSATIKISDLSTTYTSSGGANMGFFGWSETPITAPGSEKDDEGNDVAAISTDENGCIEVTGEKHLYPIFIETYLLTFYAAATGQGAAYNGPQYLNKGDYLYSLPTTSMSGKTFTGWFTGTIDGSTVSYGTQISNADGSLILGADDAGVYVSDGKLYLREDTTLFAGWTDDTSAEYRILYWQQNGTGDTYTYVEGVPGTGTVGETVSVSDANKANDRYTGFHLKEEPASAVVKADGSTVLNVYYDHNDNYVPAAGTYTLTFADSVTEDGKISPDLNPSQTKSVENGTILIEQAIENPVSGRKGYSFSNWFLDPYCTQIADLNTITMPDHDLTLYAGWEVEWYVVSIDPNYGELRPLNDQGVPTGTGSTYFWQTIEREPIAEYTYVERNYVASSSGTFYYVYHPGDGKGGSVWPDRYTYYTTDISKATEDTTFEYAPGTYTYAGWYEILDDGTEVPYVFGERTDHNTNLKLHWKKNGVYYLAYDAGDGTLEDGTTKSVVLPSGYADYAEVVLTQSAIAPTGYTFIGWQISGSDSSVIYTPGQTFTLHADDAKRASGKDIVYLDAVYARVGTATIIYNANGGTVAENNVDFGKVPGSSTDEWNTASGTVDTTAGTATVSGLANNSKFKLSDGTGFTAPEGSNATFLGWSDKAVCDDSATFYSKDSNVTYGINTAEPTTLYAVWGAQVTYNLGSTDADWGSEAWDTAVYTLDAGTNSYSQTANLGTVVTEPTKVPVYTGADERLFRYWATRTGEGTEEIYTEYDFSQPITGALDLYAYWSEANTVTVHAVDASAAVLVDKTEDAAWTVTDVTVSATETLLDGISHVTAPSDYAFAFVAVASDLNSVSRSNAVTAIKYENKKVLVKYEGETSFRVLGEGKELYFVYYQEKALNIGYKSMEASGVLENVATTDAPTTTNLLLGEYSMSAQLTAPLGFATGYTNYAFAVGSIDSGTEMNASNLSLITNAVGADDPIPTLRVRNTWRGFEYTTETGDDAVWTSCGYAPQLYVIYYSQQPTVVMFDEKTVGTSAVMNTEFTFNLLVTATTTTTVSVQTQIKNGNDEWENSGEPTVTTTTGDPTTVFDTTASGNQPYILKNGEANSSILFYSSSVQIGQPIEVDENTRTITTTTTVTAQTAKLTQTANDSFTTAIDVDGTAYTESPNVYTYTANGSGGTINVTFTNTHKSLPVEVHVAMVENDGTSGGIMQRDGSFRSTTEANYKFDLALGTSETLLTKLPSSAVFTGDTDTYAFGTVMSGIGAEGTAITVGSMGVASIAYEPISGNVYGMVLKDSDGNTISELGSDQLYYLYYPMPKIRYVKEAADGTLTDITGCLEDTTTGSIVESDSVTYSHALLTMNGKTVEQNESFEIPLSGFVISQSGNNFRMPPVLDDGLYERYLSYGKLGAGSGGATNSSELDVSTGLTMQLKVQNNTLQYSFDGTTWRDLPLPGTPTIYAIYTERGYDFQISKTVDTSESGENAIFSNASFTVTISSDAITKDSYDAEGAESATVTATPATETTPGMITLTVVDGTKVRIKGLGRGDYTVTEAGNENYTLTARTGPIVGSSTSPMTVTDNTTVTFTLDTEKKVDLTNSPKAICKIDDHYFYTLRSMVEYVDSEIATKTATAEMLTDYLIPAADTVEIPNGCDITLTTIEDPSVIDHAAVITRTEALADVPLLTNNGTLTITNVTLEGSNINATAPMIQSAGDLTIGSGATVCNAVNGGVINATAGNINVSGIIINCSAAEGGAIYHSGNSTISLRGTGTIQNNTATSGSGGAIWLAGGTVKVSGTAKITGNKAESGNGGAVYCPGTVVIEVDQGGSVTSNIAKEGGAIYAETGAISISKTAENVSPAITGNTATTGNGGAIHVGTGSVSVSGGSVSNNKAVNGLGGAIYANAASVTVSGTVEVKTNTAKEGGAVYAVSGAVEVSGGAVDNNTASTGNGGAIYAGSGHVTLSGGSVSGNRATAGSGGAVYAGIGNVTVSGGSLSGNTAKTDGGAIYVESGTVSVLTHTVTVTVTDENGEVVTDGEGNPVTQEQEIVPSISGNIATTGKGGALFAASGAVSIAGTTLTGNSAGSDGGAVYAGTGAVTLTNSLFGGDTAAEGNTAGGSGGAIYAGSGNVTVSGGSMQNNNATGGNGGALYAGSGAATMSTVTLSGNSAATGKGGAVYLDSGSLTLTTVTATGNSAVNGAAIFTNTGRANFSAGSYTGNVASEGGAVGVGSKDARLYFTGDVQVKDNKLGTGDDAPKSNVYLDQDDDAVINIDTLESDADIGIYVADSVENTRGVPGARFAVYTSNANVAKITNDRYASLTVQSDTAAKKLYWGNVVRIEVMYLGSYSNGLPNGTSSGRGTSVKDITTYYPTINSEGEVALSELAADVYTKYSDVSNWFKNNSHPNATFGAAFYYNASDYSYDITTLIWNKTAEKWQVRTRGGQTVDLPGRIYVIYSEPAYISIENNTEEKLTIGDLKMTVNGSPISVINSSTSTGYGMVFAKNGAIRTALLPITASDLTLAAGQSVSLLIPGGQNMAYTLDGSFETTTGGEVRLRRGAETSLSEETVTVSAADGTFEHLTGTTLNAAGTYNIIFGDNKIVCKVVDAARKEHPYSKISDAIADIVATTGANPPYALTTAKTATIEMVTDYLLTASDDVNIPQGYDITLTTAAKTGAIYCYDGTGNRAIISRDTQNTDSMIKAWNALESNKVVTTLRLKNLIIDGKSVRGSSDGGAVATQYVNVYIDTVDFKNVYASNGGALLVMFNFNRTTTKEVKDTLPGTILEVNDSDFTGCTSTTTVTSNRLGGGAIVTNAETMTLEDCDFTNCTAVDQAGAVFHRVDKNNNSWTNITGCTFTNCSANAAGGLELDSKTITVTDCTFEHCVATQRNGGGFNVYALNAGTPTADCWVTVSGCTFNDCQLTTTNTNNGNGGGFRCNAVYTKVENSTFTNNQALFGGGFCISNGNAKKAEVYGCTFERNTANQGGGIFGKPKEFIVGDYTYTDNSGVEKTRHTEIKNCTSKNEGGGIYHDKNADGTSLTVTNATISGNRTTNGSKNGGGIFTNCRAVTVNGSTITDNTCTNLGGGLYAYSYTSLTIMDSSISRNISSGNGGGVWFDADGDTNRALQVLTIKGSSIDGNTSNGNGGGVYTLAKTVIIGASETRTDSEGKAIRSSVSNNTAKTNGGGVYQSRNVAGSSLTIAGANIDGNTANNTNTGTDQGGGGIFAGVRTLTVTDSTVSNNTAKSHGGGILFEINNNDARNAMSLTVTGSTLDNNTSDGNGGGIYTRAKTVLIQANGSGDDAVPTKISNCTAKWCGGGVYQSRDVEGSALTVTGSTISGCVSNDTSTDTNPPRGGGGIFAYAQTITVTGSTISNNKAVRNGGGIDAPWEGNDKALIIDRTTVTGNNASNQGGGIYTRSQLTLRNGTEITGNRLTTNTAANCAGVYLNNNRTLFVGSEGAATDTIIVRGNTTANGTLSDLRLWDNGSENNSTSTYVYCSLSDDSEIRVVNAAKVSTWFGSAEIAYPNGFSDDNAVFRADSSTLHGIIDRTDPDGKKIIWAGPPIAKLTDGGGTLLYIRYTEGGALYPAIFDRLDTGNNSAGSTVSPFNMLRMDTLTLYYSDGAVYGGSDYCVKMLVEHYETTGDMTLPYVEGRTVTFTTAGKNDTDGYPFEGKAGGRATVIRGSSVSSSRTLLNVFGDLILENIVIDGGTENGVAVNSSTRCMWIDNENCTVTLGENAVLQNGHVNTSNDGGGVYVKTGALKIRGGVIRNCTARNGGGVYKQGGQVLALEAGSIYQCTATGKGGGVYLNGGSFNMSGGTINGGRADQGGGVYVVNNASVPFNMSGGSIINNSAATAGGGIAVEGINSRLYFSGKVNISGNTSDASVAKNYACNVELNQSSKAVINTNNGGLFAGSYIGVYVPGNDTTNPYKDYGGERDNFGTFVTDDNTATFYSFVNDRNGLKGGIIENPSPNTIYWIQIFSLEVSKEVESGDSTAIDSDEQFLFKVNIRGNATVTGQLNAAEIDSDDGEYGEMHFDSNGRDTTTAVFALKDGESITGVNLSEGLTYEVIEYLTVEQADRYAAMPMNGYNLTTESLTYNGTTYRVIKANTYTSTIGENKSRSDVDPYTSSLKFTNLMPVCKITDMSGNLLYRRYDWDKVTNKTGEGEDGGSSTNQPFYYSPAVYTELTGDDGAFKALEGTLYTSNGSNPTSYSVSNGVQIQMLIGNYSLNESVDANTSKVTLTTASSDDSMFPKQDTGTTSTIRRAFADDTMFDVTGDLTLATIIIDGVKGSYTIEANGGIAKVLSGGMLTIQSGAVLQNSRTAENYYGGAVYVASGGSVTMTGGSVNHNESVGNGAGIYLDVDSTLKLSGAPNFGGTGTNVSGNITTANGNFKTGALVAKLNGGKDYTRARQDIFLAEGNENPASIMLTDNLKGPAGSIWIWADNVIHYRMMMPFATIDKNGGISPESYSIFRNARTDDLTLCEGDTYLTGSAGKVKSFVYWTGGFTIQFKKVNEDKEPLTGATFGLYTDEMCQTPFMQDSKDATANAADGTNAYKDAKGNRLDKGVVLFRKIPTGTFYLKETVFPTVDADGTRKTFVDMGAIYRLVIDDEGNYTLSLEDGTEQGEALAKDVDDETGLYMVVNSVAVCKLTDDSDWLLYRDAAHTQPAVYGTLKAGFEAAAGDLYTASGAPFNANAIKLKILRDYDMVEAVTNAATRTVTLTTAETRKADTKSAADIYIFETDRTSDRARAIITRDYDERSMITNTGSGLSLATILLDGGSTAMTKRSANENGGIVNVTAGKLSIDNGATLRNSTTTANGGAVYVASGATVEMTGGEITGNSAVNGGAVYVASGATMEMKDGKDASNADTHGTINGNTATTSGAGIYLEDNTTLKLSGSPDFGGAGSSDGTLITSKDVDGETVTTGNFVTMAYSEKKNGGMDYPEIIPATDPKTYSVRQDIFMIGYLGKTDTTPKPATSIVVAGALSPVTEGEEGYIWVWAEKPAADTEESKEEDNHYEMLKQFAVFATEATLDEATMQATMRAFRNAQDDETTGCGADYLTGQGGDDLKDATGKNWKCIYWTGGFDFVFRKINGDGNVFEEKDASDNPLVVPEFTLYLAVKKDNKLVPVKAGTKDTPAENLEATALDTSEWQAYQQPDKDNPGQKKDATGKSQTILVSAPVTVKEYAATGKPVDRQVYGEGLVPFEKIPPGDYFMVETTRPDGWQSMFDVYRVYVDGAGWISITPVEKDATGKQDWPASTAPTEPYKGTETLKLTTKFVRNGEDENAPYTWVEPVATDAATTDVYNIMNVSTLNRKVILRKVDSADYGPLMDAKFTVYYADKQTVVEVKTKQTDGTETTETLKDLTSGAAGAFWIGKLPFGTYYLHETSVPSGYNKLATNDNWFVLTVNKDGVGYLAADADEDTKPNNKINAEASKP